MLTVEGAELGLVSHLLPQPIGQPEALKARALRYRPQPLGEHKVVI
jgi:hypothetical protein